MNQKTFMIYAVMFDMEILENMMKMYCKHQIYYGIRCLNLLSKINFSVLRPSVSQEAKTA